MRIATYYDNLCSGRNDGNPLYTLFALKNLPDVEVVHLLPRGEISDFGKFDWHLWVDWGEDGLTEILSYDVWPELPSPCAYWASDTHLGFDYRLMRAKQAAKVFCAQKRAVEEFGLAGVDAEWLPHAVEPQAYPATQYAERKYDLCFVGHINSENRIEALERMFREFPNFWFGQRLFEGAADIYCQSKIVFNISMKDDLNMRVFEALGTKSLLLTNDIPTLHDLFEDGKHLATYKTMDEAVEKARWYIDHESEREAVAAAGYAEVMAKHTFKHRVSRIMEAMSK